MTTFIFEINASEIKQAQNIEFKQENVPEHFEKIIKQRLILIPDFSFSHKSLKLLSPPGLS